MKLYEKNRTFFITKSILSKDYLADKGLDETHIFALGVGMNRDALENKEANQSDVCSLICLFPITVIIQILIWYLRL